MKRTSLIVIVLMGITAITLVTAITPAEAGSLQNLRGDYSILVSETVAAGPSTIIYCNGFGTISFDGMGSGAATVTTRCIQPGGSPDVSTDTLALEYKVSPDGNMWMRPVGEEEWTIHCQLADGGNTVLCDATEMMGADILDWQTIAVKKKGSDSK